MSDTVASAPDTTADNAAPAVETTLPYAQAVPGAVIGVWANDTDAALFVAPDKLLEF